MGPTTMSKKKTAAHKGLRKPRIRKKRTKLKARKNRLKPMPPKARKSVKRQRVKASKR